MDSSDLLPLLEQLDDNVDDLEEALEPILGRSLSKVSKNLPLMDKAKLHVLITYTLESFIFCSSLIASSHGIVLTICSLSTASGRRRKATSCLPGN